MKQMTHDMAHCSGEIGPYSCSLRVRCARYHLHLAAKERGLTYVLYFTHIVPFPGGEEHILDISNGCCEYIDINDK